MRAPGSRGLAFLVSSVPQLARSWEVTHSGGNAGRRRGVRPATKADLFRTRLKTVSNRAWANPRLGAILRRGPAPRGRRQWSGLGKALRLFSRGVQSRGSFGLRTSAWAIDSRGRHVALGDDRRAPARFRPRACPEHPAPRRSLTGDRRLVYVPGRTRTGGPAPDGDFVPERPLMAATAACGA